MPTASPILYLLGVTPAIGAVPGATAAALNSNPSKGSSVKSKDIAAASALGLITGVTQAQSAASPIRNLIKEFRELDTVSGTAKSADELFKNPDNKHPAVLALEMVIKFRINQAASNTAEFEPLENPHVVCIDPGHGGRDSGADRKRNGIHYIERDIVEGIAIHLMEFLENDKNYVPVLTREIPFTRPQNQLPNPNNRATISNSKKAELLLSIHINAAGTEEDTEAEGYESYPIPPTSRGVTRVFHEESLRFGRLLRDQAVAYGFDDRGVRYAFFTNEGRKFAREHELSEIKKLGIYPTLGILESSQCPTVLSENGFIGNPHDLGLMGAPEAWKNVATYMYKAICEYFKTKPML
jgi:N-acetylmuramoyl-L-alanine amidase